MWQTFEVLKMISWWSLDKEIYLLSHQPKDIKSFNSELEALRRQR